MRTPHRCDRVQFSGEPFAKVARCDECGQVWVLIATRRDPETDEPTGWQWFCETEVEVA